MDNTQNLLEESILEYDQLQKFIKQTTSSSIKETIDSQLSEAINNIIKEDEEEKPEIEDVDIDKEKDTDGETDVVDDSVEIETEPAGDESEVLDTEMDSTENVEDGEEDFDLEKYKVGDTDEYDLSNASSDDLIKVFKKVTDEDEVEIVKMDNGMIDLVDGEEEYIIDLNEEIEDEDIEIIDLDKDSIEKEGSDDDDIELEIVLDADEEGEGVIDEKVMTQSPSVNRRDGALSQTRAEYAPNPKRKGGVLVQEEEGVDSKQAELDDIKMKYESIQEENKKLKSLVSQFSTSLKESAILTNNLAKYTKLVTENATSKDEKISILERFSNDAKTIESGNSLYETIEKELKNKKAPVIEALDKQIVTEANTSKAKEKVIYESVELNNIKSLMERMKI